MEARRERTDTKLFNGEPPPDGLRSLADVMDAWPIQDREDIRKELGARPDEVVAFVVRAVHRYEGRKLIEAYELVGTFGPGEGYDIATDARAATRLTHDLMQRGATAIAAGKKS